MPTGSKRPSPSPSEGEEDREAKKTRTQPSDIEGTGIQLDELAFSFTDFPCEDFFGNQPEIFGNNQDAHGMLVSTTTHLDLGYDGMPPAFTTSDTGYGTNLGDELATAALDINPWDEADIVWKDFFQNPYQGSESHVDRHAIDGPRYADQFGDLITNDYDGKTQTDDIPMGESEVIIASHDSPSGIGGWSSAKSIPVCQTQVYEQPSQSLAASFPKESVDVRKNCDTCFGVVSADFLSLAISF